MCGGSASDQRRLRRMTTERSFDQPKVYGPARLYWWLMLGGSLAFLVPIVLFWSAVEDGAGKILFVVIFGTCAIFSLFVLTTGRPYLVFSADGIARWAPFGNRTWVWAEVGPISLAEFTYRFSTQRVLVAYSDANHDLLVASGQTGQARLSTADIEISLVGLKGGHRTSTAQEIADEANAWRERFGRPKVAAANDPKAAAKLRRRIRIRYWRFWILISLGGLGIYWVSTLFE